MIELLNNSNKIYPFSVFGNDINNVPTNTLILDVPSYGSLPTADSSTWNQFAAVSGVTYKCRRVFRNSGTDYVNCGQPSNIFNLVKPTVPFTAKVVANNSNVTQTSRLYNIASGGVNVTIAVAVVNTGIVNAANGSTDTVITNVLSANNWYSHLTSANSTHVAAVYSDAFKTVNTSASARTSANPIFDLVIGAQSNLTSAFNFEGDTAYLEFRDVSGNLVDLYDFNSADLWDGGTSGKSVMGNPFTVTDGTPTGVVAYSWIPISVTNDTINYSTYLARYTAELNSDTLSFPVLSTDLRFVPWTIEWMCNDYNTAQTSTNRLIQILNNGPGNQTSALVYKTSQSYILCEFRSGGGTGLFSVSGNVPPSGWFKIKIVKNGTTSGTVQLYVNDILQSTSTTINYSLWTDADKIVAVSMLDATAELRPYGVCNYLATLNGIPIDSIACNETSGTSLANTITPSRSASLSDSNAHAKALVPLI